MYLQIEDRSLEDFRDKEIILFGAGSCGLRVIEEFEHIGAKIICICDNNKNLDGTLLKGYTIRHPEILINHPNIPIILSSTFGKEIKEQLSQMGINNTYKTKVGVHKANLPKEEFANRFIEPEEANKSLYTAILGNKPFFIGRLGSVEMECMCHYFYFLDRVNGSNKPYPPNIKMIMSINAGFFPSEDDYLDEFAILYLEDMKEMDVIWCRFLSQFENKIYSDFYADKVVTEYKHTCLPNLYNDPWTGALKGKRVLVIHPFATSIRKNYEIRDKLYDNKRFMPDFELLTYKPVQSIAGNKTEYNTWFDALEAMKQDISEIDFDVALIGAGAYGLVLGAYIKKLGKKAIHIGGILQLYFGIRGKAWDKYNIHNDYWTRPTVEEVPNGHDKVEAGRYW
ncbi:MAG: hypothetical protein WCD89_17965 [Anaerocolumna sp.]